jgi:O-antigen ligase
MGFTSVVSTILALHDYGFKKRIFYLITAAVTFYGMAISGTRGALFVPLTGFLVYLFLSKNFKTLSAGAAVLGILFYILKFTFIGQGNYQVQRMRSALDPNDASFQARIENQKKFNDYLSTRPFGGGIGTAGFWGQRFSPRTFLAETPTDSHYVRIWAETGIVGLVVHILVLISILGISFFRIYKMTDVAVKQKLMAIFAGCAGIIVASYGNQVMGQMPTNVYFYISLALIYLGPHWEKNNVLDKHL